MEFRESKTEKRTVEEIIPKNRRQFRRGSQSTTHESYTGMEEAPQIAVKQRTTSGERSKTGQYIRHPGPVGDRPPICEGPRCCFVGSC
jgi:hypothetical protein